MQAAAFLAQQVHRGDADLDVFGDGPFVEAVGLARQLDLAVQRLVGHAQERAVGHAEAIALGGDGGRFHVDSHRARLREAQGRGGVAQLPVAVVGGHHRAGAQALLEGFSVLSRDHLGGAIERLLDLGQGRQGDLRRQHLVQHMVIAQIGVGQDVVADGLVGPKAAAVADHQPGLGPQHRQVVGDGLGVGRAHPDVDQADPGPVRPHQVVGGHLVLAPGAVGHRALGFGRLGPHHDAAGAAHLGVAGVGVAQLLAGPLHEGVHIAVVVGEQDVLLHVLGRGAGVVGQARQGEVDPRAVEQAERAGLLQGRVPQAVGGLVADAGEVGGGEPARHLARGQGVEAQVLARVEHVRVRDLLLGGPDGDLDLVVARQIAELLDQIGPEEGRAGDSDGVQTRIAEAPVGARAARGLQRLARLGIVGHPDLGIGEQAAQPVLQHGAHPGLQIGLERVLQVLDGLFVELLQPVDDRRQVFHLGHGPTIAGPCDRFERLTYRPHA